MIAQSQPSRRDAEQLVRAARLRILELFPGREQTYEIVCAPRFRRVIDEFTPREPDPSARAVLPFQTRSREH